MFDETTKTVLTENSGSIIGVIAAGLAAFWGLWKVLPVFNGNMDTAAKSASIQNAMLSTLIAERDAMKQQLDELRVRYEEVFRSEAQHRAQLAAANERIAAYGVLLEKYEAHCKHHGKQNLPHEGDHHA